MSPPMGGYEERYALYELANVPGLWHEQLLEPLVLERVS